MDNDSDHGFGGGGSSFGGGGDFGGGMSSGFGGGGIDSSFGDHHFGDHSFGDHHFGHSDAFNVSNDMGMGGMGLHNDQPQPGVIHHHHHHDRPMFGHRWGFGRRRYGDYGYGPGYGGGYGYGYGPGISLGSCSNTWCAWVITGVTVLTSALAILGIFLLAFFVSGQELIGTTVMIVVGVIAAIAVVCGLGLIAYGYHRKKTAPPPAATTTTTTTVPAGQPAVAPTTTVVQTVPGQPAYPAGYSQPVQTVVYQPGYNPQQVSPNAGFVTQPLIQPTLPVDPATQQPASNPSFAPAHPEATAPPK